MCVTEGNQGPCVFPFKYLGVEYNECIPPSLHDGLLGGNGTGPWCATKVWGNLSHDKEHRAICKPNCKVVSSILLMTMKSGDYKT